MRVCYIGNFIPPNSTEHHIAVSFEALGHHVLRLQENNLPSAHDTLHNNGIDLLLYTRTWNSLTPDWLDVWLDPPPGITTAAVHLDLWFGLDRAHEVREHAMFKAQHFFGVDGDHDAEYAAAGVNHHWLRAGVVDLALVGETLGTPDRDSWPYDVAFVGSRKYHHEWPRAELIDELRDRYGPRFIHVGKDGDLPPDEHGHRTLRGQALNDFYASVRVVVGDSLGARIDGRYWSDRAYEGFGRGAYMIFPAIAELGAEIGNYPAWTPGDYDGLHSNIDAALHDAYHRDGTTERLGGWVREHCTYTNRAAELIDTLVREGALPEDRAA